jgi:hypothetical protein
MRAHTIGAFVFVVGAVGTGCSAAPSACNAGDTRQCVGPGACAGGQVCGSDRTWSACDCGGSGDSGIVLRDAPTAADAGADTSGRCSVNDPPVTSSTDCNSACTAVFDCALTTCGGTTQLCPNVHEPQRASFVSNCASACNANPSIKSFIDPTDCRGTITNFRAVDPSFATYCGA